LDSVLDRLRPEKSGLAIHAFLNMDERMFRELDAALGAVPALSESEAGLRGGFFVTALLLRHIEREQLGDDALLQGFSALHP
jgi:hypothetical protein